MSFYRADLCPLESLLTQICILPNHNYLCNQCLSPLKLWRGVLDTTLCDKVCQWLATGRWFSPVSVTNKTDRHDITPHTLYSQNEAGRALWSKALWNTCSSLKKKFKNLNTSICACSLHKNEDKSQAIYISINSCVGNSWWTAMDYV
jgi:hypothetical protein